MKPHDRPVAGAQHTAAVFLAGNPQQSVLEIAYVTIQIHSAFSIQHYSKISHPNCEESFPSQMPGVHSQ